jgi:hypothetical protein
MTKYRSYERNAKPIRRTEPHPVWRGIGCFIMLIVPALSLGFSTIMVEAALSMGVDLPPGLLGYPVMPEILFRVPGLVGILGWIQSLNNLYAILVGAFVLILVLGTIMSVVYAFIYRLVGPPRYNEFDAPPTGARVRKYKR